jgi:hypothetical protein
MSTSSKLIPLTQEQVALVDATDYEFLVQWSWYAAFDPTTRSFYAVRHEKRENGRQGTVKMHRAILGLERGDKRTVDHENHDTLDNRRRNLRIATFSQQAQNRRKRQTNKSGFKGVSLESRRGKFIAQLEIAGRRKYLGSFDTPQEASVRYQQAVRALHGEFARVE